MPSTKELLTLDRQHGGVDSTSEPILVADDSWIVHHNMRPFQGKIVQAPRKVLLGEVEPCCQFEILALVNIPSARYDFGHLVALTQRRAYRVIEPVSSSIPLQDVTGVLNFAYDLKYRRWGTTVYNGQLFFVNELNPVLCCDGTAVRYLSGDTPRARYITHYFDHLVVGWVDVDGVVMPGRMHWSNLYGFSQWRPAQSNESDHWDFDEDATGNEFLRGITGMERLGDVLYVTTPTSIRPVRYVGLPRVFQVGENLSGGIGNGLMYGLVKANNALFFFDMREFNFFMFSAQGVQPIGGPIQGYLQATASTDPTLQQRTWGYHRPEFYEVGWVFCSNQSAGNFDKQIVFNYRSGKWWTGSVENTHSFGGMIRPATRVDELASTIGSQAFVIGDLGGVPGLLPRVWGTTDGRLLREEIASDLTEDLLPQETPVLETKDYHLNDLQSYKEVDTVTIHTTYVDADAVEVEVAARDDVDGAVEYPHPLIWRPTLAHHRLTELRSAGRIFRFRYKPQPLPILPVTVEQECPLPATPLSGQLTTWMKFVPGTGTPDYDYPFNGNTEIYTLSSWRDDPPGQFLEFDYVYDAPATANPDDDIPTALLMREDVMLHGAEVLAALGPPGPYYGVSAPKWKYYSGSFSGTIHTYYPLRGPETVFTEGWSLEVKGFSPAANPGLLDGYDASSSRLISSGVNTSAVPGTSYTARVRVRAVAPLMTYSGGTNDGAFLQTGGAPSSPIGVTVKLEVSDPATTYYLNRGTAITQHLEAIDFEVDLPITGGATVTLTLALLAGALPSYDVYGRLPKIAGRDPSRDTWVDVDYSLSLAGGAVSRVISHQKGGGVRGWKWSGITYNVYTQKAEK